MTYDFLTLFHIIQPLQLLGPSSIQDYHQNKQLNKQFCSNKKSAGIIIAVLFKLMYVWQ